MPTTSPRRRSRRIAAGLATSCLAVTLVILDAGVAASADARSSTSPYLMELFRAQDTCLERATLPVAAGSTARCVGDLAQPDRGSSYQVDLFRLFSNCLYLAEQRALDDSTPPTTETYEDYVNDCLGL
jgi:hypothetical protein